MSIDLGGYLRLIAVSCRAMASFQAIYEDVLRGVYLDRYDAVKLAHVEINDRKEVLESAKTPRRSTEIPGLVKLSEDINALLHGAYIKEQGVVIAMKNSLSQSHHTIHQHALVSHSDYSELPIAESDSVVPLSEDEASSVLRGLKFQLQVTFDETVDVTSQKLNALEQIRNIYHLYTSMIAEVARECGLSEPYVRASHAVGTYCDAAIRHKYFDTSSVSVTQSLLRIVMCGRSMKCARHLSHYTLSCSCGAMSTWPKQECSSMYVHDFLY